MVCNYKDYWKDEVDESILRAGALPCGHQGLFTLEKVQEKKCLYCSKILEIGEGTKRLNPRRKFCNRTCQTRFAAKKRYNLIKDNEEYKLKKRTFFKEVWYPNNKERQKKNILNDYYKNKKTWQERKNTNDHKRELLKMLSSICAVCGKEEVKIIFHKEYGHYQTLLCSRGEKQKKINLEKLREYSKYLIPLCSKKCMSIAKRLKKEGKLI